MKKVLTVGAMVVGCLLVMIGAMATKTNFVGAMITFCVGGVVACSGFIFHDVEVAE